jgi:hypothetical protein
MSKEQPQDDFIRKIVEQLACNEAEIQPDTAARLRGSRLKALELVERPSSALIPRWLTFSGLATAVVLVVAVSLWTMVPKTAEIAMNPEDMEVLTAPEQIDLFRDLEFYRWLAGGENGR